MLAIQSIIVKLRTFKFAKLMIYRVRSNWRRANRNGGGDCAADDTSSNRTRSELRVQRLLNRPGVRNILETRIRFESWKPELTLISCSVPTILSPLQRFTKRLVRGCENFLPALA